MHGTQSSTTYNDEKDSMQPKRSQVFMHNVDKCPPSFIMAHWVIGSTHHVIPMVRQLQIQQDQRKKLLGWNRLGLEKGARVRRETLRLWKSKSYGQLFVGQQPCRINKMYKHLEFHVQIHNCFLCFLWMAWDTGR